MKRSHSRQNVARHVGRALLPVPHRPTGKSARPTRSARSAGTTLAEVLVSIMILSIGLISLAALFPISILRGLQATQLTNGTIHRFNAEAQIEVTPSLVYNPAVPTQSVTGSNYLVDPLGAAEGLGTISENPVVNSPVNRISRFPGAAAFDAGTNPMTAKADAFNFVTLPDSWVDLEETGRGEFATQTDGTPVWDTSVTPNVGRITLPVDVSSEVNITAPVVSRIVLFDADLRASHSRIITGFNGQDVEWKNDLNGDMLDDVADNGAIPSSFVAGSFRIQTREIRYTWMLTVRNNASGLASVDVVVFFRRSFSPEDDVVHDATFISGSRQVGFIQKAGSDPFVKKGGFVLDVQNAQWYRIQDILPGRNGYTNILEIDKPAFSSAGEDTSTATNPILNGVLDNGNPPEDINGNNTLDFGGAVFMQGVVEVYPLGIK